MPGTKVLASLGAGRPRWAQRRASAITDIIIVVVVRRHWRVLGSNISVAAHEVIVWIISRCNHGTSAARKKSAHEHGQDRAHRRQRQNTEPRLSTHCNTEARAEREHEWHCDGPSCNSCRIPCNIGELFGREAGYTRRHEVRAVEQNRQVDLIHHDYQAGHDSERYTKRHRPTNHGRRECTAGEPLNRRAQRC